MNTSGKHLLTTTRGIITAALAFGTVVAALVGAHSYVRTLVWDTTHDAAFLHDLASEIQPTAIVNDSGSILFDGGAMEYLNEITVQWKTNIARGFTMGGPSDGIAPAVIIVRPNRHLSYPPILEALNGNYFSTDITRGKGYDWTYTLGMTSYNLISTPAQFRIQIVQ